MIKTIKVQELMIGMFVVLPVTWFQHPFLKNEFIIKSQDQINKFIDYGINEVNIDPSRGIPLTETSSVSHESDNSFKIPPKTWEPEKLVPFELKEAIHDKKLSAKKKSKIVYETSRVMVERLFEDPKAENIHVVKKEIAEIVDLILVDNTTSKEMLKLTSYDYYTYTHSVNVGVFSVMLAK